MSTVTERLPTPTVLRGIPYDVYSMVRDNPDNDGHRMTYVNGTLEIMSPEFRHEGGGRRLALIVGACASVFKMKCVGARSTTFKRGQIGDVKGFGKEPDESFYFTQAALICKKDTIDLEIDPPPDLWIEVDNWSSSKGSLPLYAGLGVPEVWRYRPHRRSLWFGRLRDGDYVKIARSQFLHNLTPAIVLTLLREGGASDDTSWDDWMRGWTDTTLRRMDK